jgi:threonine synthase
MDYVSTRGSAPALDFEGVTLTGLASDGGLYLPRTWPRFTADELAALAGLPYAELATRVMLPFVGDSLTEDRLRALSREAYARFAHAAVTGCWSCSMARRWRSRTSRCSCSDGCSRSSCRAATIA